MNQAIGSLRPYPFERLNKIKQCVTGRNDLKAIDLSVGEPKHTVPEFILECLKKECDGVARYPTTRGTPELRAAIRDWLIRRFLLPPDIICAERHILPVNGTREALFAIAQCLVAHEKPDPLVVIPNPFYPIYEGAALLAGALPWYLHCPKERGFVPDFSAVSPEIWERCQLLYVCSPNNPTGTVLSEEQFAIPIQLADRYNFVIASDECYSEIYPDEGNPPVGLLQAASRNGRIDFRRCLVFNSLSKRSSVPGLRSGFVAGDAELIEAFYRYRTYHGCAMPPPIQAASAKAWTKEEHVLASRVLYREKFDAVLEILAPILPIVRAQGGFFLWPQLPVDDVRFTCDLYAEQNVTVLPGSFLARESLGSDPGRGFVRIALVPSVADCVEAARRMRRHVETFY
ncbi:MAG: succinyldiaminopimelate transaminase [Gammaproteobacteria bacterium]